MSSYIPPALGVDPGTTAVPDPRRRPQPQLSCNFCRRRKIKCDRGLPCETCSRRGIASSCAYANARSRAARVEGQDSASIPPSDIMQSRVDHLESLVISLMNTVSGSSGGGSHGSSNGRQTSAEQSPPPAWTRADSHPDSQKVPELQKDFGRISLDKEKTSYVDGSHWTAILDEISDLKDYFDRDSTDAGHHSKESSPPQDLDIFLTYDRATSSEELLAAVPAKHVADDLVAKYFSTLSTARILFHKPTFFKEYMKFWKDPMSMPIMWVGLLFSMLTLGALYHRMQLFPAGQQFPANSQSILDTDYTVETYKAKTAQCLVMGKYTECPPHTVETLLHYLHIGFVQHDDANTDTWVTLGIIVRLALRMGYHRDGSHSASLTPFQAEMRRRAWAIIFQLDAVGSAQFGLPRMIQQSQSDTAAPRNLLDMDFDENMTELPPSRPDSFQTPIQFVNSKNKVVSAFAMITDVTLSTLTPSYDEVMSLDRTLRKAYNSLPPEMRDQASASLINDQPEKVVRRLYLALLFQKSRCFLHRKYLLRARTDPKYAYSRSSCVDSALEILRSQATIHESAAQPGSRLYQKYKISSLINAIFLLATSVLCLDLDQDVASKLDPSRSRELSDPATRSQVVQTLTTSYRIWLVYCDSSAEARKAAEGLRIVLAKAQRAFGDELAGASWIGPQVLSAEDLMYLQTSASHFAGGAAPAGLSESCYDTTFPSDVTSMPMPPTFLSLAFNSLEMATVGSGYENASFDEVLSTPDPQYMALGRGELAYM